MIVYSIYNHDHIVIIKLINAETYVSHCARWGEISLHNGRGAAETEWTHGPSSRGHRQDVSLPDMRWKHVNMSWSFRTHRTGQTGLSRWIHDKDIEAVAMRVLLLL